MIFNFQMADIKEDIRARLKEARECLGLQSKDFAEKAGLAQGNYSAIEAGTRSVGDRVLNKIADKLSINIKWLRTGEGEMLKKPQIESNAVLIQNPEIMMVPLISKYAYAGYLAGYGDDEYMEALPTIPFIIPEGQTHRGEYVAVEVKGDSMNDGSIEGIAEGDVVLCRNIDRSLWTNYKLHLRKWNFAIVHKEGIIIKRIIAHNVEAGTITIHSLNPDYRDKVIDLNDVVKIMNVVQLQRKPMI